MVATRLPPHTRCGRRPFCNGLAVERGGPSGPSQRLSTPTHDCPTRIPSGTPACQPGPAVGLTVCHSSHRCSSATQGTCRCVTGATSARRQEQTWTSAHGQVVSQATAPPTVTPLRTPPTASPLPAAPPLSSEPTPAAPRRTVEPAPSAEPGASGPTGRSRRAPVSATSNPVPPVRELPSSPSRCSVVDRQLNGCLFWSTCRTTTPSSTPSPM